MVEREHILEYLRSTLKESLGASVTVTRNLRKAASVTNVPAVFLVDGGDEVMERASGPISKKRMHLGISTFFQGSTEENAAAELAEFEKEILKALYGEQITRNVGTTYVGSLYQTKLSELSFPEDTSPRVVNRKMSFEILFVEDIRRLFTE